MGSGCAEKKDLTISDEWHIVSLAGSPVGYVHSVTRRREELQPAFVTNQFAETRFSRLGNIIKVRVSSEYIESLDGKLLFASSVSHLGGTETRCRVKLKGDNIIIETTIAGETRSRTMPSDPELIGPYEQTRRIVEQGLRPGATLTFKTFAPEHRRIVTAQLAVKGRETITLDGRELTLWRASLQQDILPGVTTDVWLDDAGSIVRSLVGLMGGMETRRSTEFQALQTVAPSHTVDIMDKFFVPSNREITNVYGVTEALYRLRIPQNVLSRLQLEDRRQTIEKRKPGEILLRVRALGDADEPASKRPDKKYLKPSPYIQSNDPEIIGIARKAGGDAQTPMETALRLRGWVYEHIRKKDFSVGFASAKEAAITRKGDCTEHAILLAALLRARGIPARLAVGLVYYQGKFGYHMWTEAFLNDWTALDAAFNEELVDATHIKLQTTALPGDSPANPFLDIVTIIGRIELSIEELKELSTPE